MSAADGRRVDRLAVLAGVRNRLRDLVLPSCAYSTATPSASSSLSSSSSSAPAAIATGRGECEGRVRGSVGVNICGRDEDGCSDTNVSKENSAGNDTDGRNIGKIENPFCTFHRTSFLRTTVTLDDLVLRMFHLYERPKEIRTENRNNRLMKNNFSNITNPDHEDQGKGTHSKAKGFDQHNYRSKIGEKDKIINRKSEVKNADGTYDISVLEASYEHIGSSSGSISVCLKLRNISM